MMCPTKDLQVENGKYTRIVNAVLDELIKANLNGSELALCLFIIRKTYGYHKTTDQISLSQLQLGTNLSRPTVVKSLKRLQLVNIVQLVNKGNSKQCSNEWCFNKYYNTWQLGNKPELVNTDELVKIFALTSKQTHKKLVNTCLHTKEITKENKRKMFQQPTLEEAKAEISAKGYSFTAEYFISYNEARGWMLGRSKMKCWKATMRTWNSNNLNQDKPKRNKL